MPSEAVPSPGAGSIRAPSWRSSSRPARRAPQRLVHEVGCELPPQRVPAPSGHRIQPRKNLGLAPPSVQPGSPETRQADSWARAAPVLLRFRGSFSAHRRERRARRQSRAWRVPGPTCRARRARGSSRPRSRCRTTEAGVWLRSGGPSRARARVRRQTASPTGPATFRSARYSSSVSTTRVGFFSVGFLKPLSGFLSRSRRPCSSLDLAAPIQDRDQELEVVFDRPVGYGPSARTDPSRTPLADEAIPVPLGQGRRVAVPSEEAEEHRHRGPVVPPGVPALGGRHLLTVDVQHSWPSGAGHPADLKLWVSVRRGQRPSLFMVPGARLSTWPGALRGIPQC